MARDGAAALTSRAVTAEAFARPVEWFALDDCEITDRGLSTPAVERIVQGRSARGEAAVQGATAAVTPMGEAATPAVLSEAARGGPRWTGRFRRRRVGGRLRRGRSSSHL
ncbi:hypothetical protein GCM10010302_75710 [Streptomyces polychromogenes]|uniref:Uncharacterized protein n=1 Tax=Streptomyces polychromogenes TaxID=67342 RepID=A0ABP3FTE0_9ACTN